MKPQLRTTPNVLAALAPMAGSASVCIAQRYGHTGLLIWHDGPLGNPLFIHHAPEELTEAIFSIVPQQYVGNATDCDKHPRAS